MDAFTLQGAAQGPTQPGRDASRALRRSAKTEVSCLDRNGRSGGIRTHDPLSPRLQEEVFPRVFVRFSTSKAPDFPCVSIPPRFTSFNLVPERVAPYWPLTSGHRTRDRLPSFTTRYLTSLDSQNSPRLEVADPSTTGLYFRVTSTGAKSWMLRYTAVDGQRRKLGLGSFPSIGLAEARKRAQEAIGQIAGGGDPAGEKKQARRNARRMVLEVPTTLNELWGRYCQVVMPRKRRATIEGQQYLWRRILAPRLGRERIDDLSRRTVRAELRIVGARTPTMANRSLTLLQHMLNFAVDEEVLTANPLNGMAKLFNETPRDRVLTDEEIRKLWKVLDHTALASDIHVSERTRTAIKLVFMTGARAQEVSGLHADEIDQTIGVWTIPPGRSKNARPQTVPLSEQAIALLQVAFDAPMGSWADFAFPNSRHPHQALERHSLSRAMSRIVKSAGLERATLHDLRRTMATMIASERIGAPLHVVSATLGHSLGGPAVTQVYNRHRYDVEKRHALEAWGRLLSELVQY